MSIATTTTTTAAAANTTVTSNSPPNDKLSSTGVHHSQHFVNERYPKTCLEDIPSIILEYPPRIFGDHPTRSRHSLRFRTQPVTLTEINERDEENKNENDNDQASQTTAHVDFQRLEHLALSENIRRTARKKNPTKNFLERQRLKVTREDSTETDGN